MLVIEAADVNDAYVQGLSLIYKQGVRQTSRAGDVLVAPCPVVTVTYQPQNRVLLCPYRRANPFFHLFECLWMLSGSRNARWLDRFVSDFSERFAEPDGNQWGAYGHRWRSHFDVDQLSLVVRALRQNPLDRRVVIAMWDPVEDLGAVSSHTGEPPRDVPCNTHIYPRIVNDALDLTVCCRSNDLYWGAHGANAVHFSFLQEYLAGRIGVGVGRLYQLSNNYHGYTSVIPAHVPPVSRRYYQDGPGAVACRPIMTDSEDWDTDLMFFMQEPLAAQEKFTNSWFYEVAQPMWRANEARLAGDWAEYWVAVAEVRASDWRAAATMWRQN
jgi:thymidylate synthase